MCRYPSIYSLFSLYCLSITKLTFIYLFIFDLFDFRYIFRFILKFFATMKLKYCTLECYGGNFKQRSTPSVSHVTATRMMHLAQHQESVDPCSPSSASCCKVLHHLKSTVILLIPQDVKQETFLKLNCYWS